MKALRTILTAIVLLAGAMTMNAQRMSIAAMQSNARFLTDRMAYTLGINDPYLIDEIYRINYDYIWGVNDYLDDVALGYYYDDYMTVCAARDAALRNLLGYTIWNRLMGYSYFHRPIVFVNRGWHFSIYDYDRYGHHHYYYSAPRPIAHGYVGGHYFHGMPPRAGRPVGPAPHVHHGGPAPHVNRGAGPAPHVNRGAGPAPHVNRGGGPAPRMNNGGTPAPHMNNGGTPAPNTHQGGTPDMNRGNNNHSDMNRGGNHSDMNRGGNTPGMRSGSNMNSSSRQQQTTHTPSFTNASMNNRGGSASMSRGGGAGMGTRSGGASMGRGGNGGAPHAGGRGGGGRR